MATIDTSEFDRAMGQYAALSAKDHAQVANDKTIDWLYKSARETPKAQRESIKRTIENPRFITWWLNRKYGRGNWERGPGDYKGDVFAGSEWAEAVKSLKKRLPTAGFLKSGFIKSAKQIRDSRQARQGREIPQKNRERYPGVKAKAIDATPQKPAASFAITSAASSSSDAITKERIQERAVKRAQARVLRDMIPYIERKMAQRAKEVSIF